jgi:hypothetical protein
MIMDLIRYFILRRDVRRAKRAYLAKAATGRAAVLTAGATITWSPIREVAKVSDFVTEAQRTELELAEADLKPMLDAFHTAMAAAFRQFDAGMLAPLATTHRWHTQAQAGTAYCQVCAEYHARTFGPIGERFGIRSFRIDTPTAEYKIYNREPMRLAA